MKAKPPTRPEKAAQRLDDRRKLEAPAYTRTDDGHKIPAPTAPKPRAKPTTKKRTSR